MSLLLDLLNVNIAADAPVPRSGNNGYNVFSLYKALAYMPYTVGTFWVRGLFACWVIMPPKELWEAYSNRTVRPSCFQVRSISPIFFEAGIPNLVCGYILGWRSVAYHFRVTVTLTFTSDLVFRIIVSRAYLLYYLR